MVGSALPTIHDRVDPFKSISPRQASGYAHLEIARSCRTPLETIAHQERGEPRGMYPQRFSQRRSQFCTESDCSIPANHVPQTILESPDDRALRLSVAIAGIPTVRTRVLEEHRPGRRSIHVSWTVFLNNLISRISRARDQTSRAVPEMPVGHVSQFLPERFPTRSAFFAVTGRTPQGRVPEVLTNF